MSRFQTIELNESIEDEITVEDCCFAYFVGYAADVHDGKVERFILEC